MSRGHRGGVRRGRVGAWAVTATGGTAFAIALLVAFAPFGSAATVHPLTTHSAPYSGAGYYTQFILSSGCASTTVGTLPNFNVTTGTGTAAENTSAHACPNQIFGTGSDGEVGVGFASAAFTTTTATHKMTATWTVAWTNALKTTNPMSKGTSDASAGVEVAIVLDDTTNDTSVYGGTWASFNSTFGAGTINFHGSAKPTVYLNASLVKGHDYVLVTFVLLIVETNITASPKSTASASVNVATKGDQGKLTSWTFK